MEPQRQKATGLAILSAIVTIVLWSGSPAATLIATYHLPPAAVGLLRTVLPALLLLPLILIWRLPLPAERRGWVDLMVSGLGGFVAFPVLFGIGMARTTTTHAALILSLAPVFTGLMGFAMARARPRPLWFLGAALAVAGEAVLILGRGSGSDAGAASIAGDLIVLASILVASAGYLAGGRLSARTGAWAATSWALVLAGAVLLPFSGDALSALLSLRGEALDSLAALAFLVLGVVIAGYALWFYAIGLAGPGRIAPIQFAMPVFSLILAVVLMGETITPTIIAATCLILGGVTLCRRGASPGRG